MPNLATMDSLKWVGWAVGQYYFYMRPLMTMIGPGCQCSRLKPEIDGEKGHGSERHDTGKIYQGTSKKGSMGPVGGSRLEAG